jgi:hypothetical protein
MVNRMQEKGPGASSILSDDEPFCFHGTPVGQTCEKCLDYLRRAEEARRKGDWKALELLSKEMKQELQRYHGSSLTFYLPGKSPQEAKAIRRELNAIAETLGYKAERGKTRGDGTTGRVLIALAQGELLLVRASEWKGHVERGSS